MMKRFLCFLAFFAVCSSLVVANTSVNICLKYGNVINETKYNPKGEIVEKIIKEEGQSNISLQLIDLIALNLKNKSYDAYVNSENECDYKIVINPVFLQFGVIYACSTLVEVYKGDTLVDYNLLSDDKNPVRLTEAIANQIVKYIAGVIK